MKNQQKMSAFVLFIICCSICLTLSIRSRNKFETKSNSYYSQTNFKTSLSQKQTDLQSSNELAINYLDRHIIDCTGKNSAINSFRLVT
jgi:hypothetical protein